MNHTTVLLFFLTLTFPFAGKAQATGAQERLYWIETLQKIADPVLVNLSQQTLKKNMPFESLATDSLRRDVSYLEALGRTVCGIAPWLELGPDASEEGRLRKKYIERTVQAISHAVDPQSADYLVFDNWHSQPLVDAAFLAHGLLRAPKQLWGNLREEAKRNLITALKTTRSIKPNESNWLLFASIVEAALLEFSGDYDPYRLYRGVDRFCDEWYTGDGWYSDGANFRIDYYNSFVIHPMLTDVLIILEKHGMKGREYLPEQLKRFTRYAAEQERFISPEGTYPIVGRSIAYRFGVFQALSQASLMHILPADLPYGQVRSALTAVLKKQLKSPRNFDADGWLKIGFTGSQIGMSEAYINTGSLYLCTAVFLPLGLPATAPFWADPYTEWTNLKGWNGIDVGRDKGFK